MVYGICFLVSLLVLLVSIAINDRMKTNLLLLLVVTVIGDGGYYALHLSQTPEAAILANKLAYAIGMFSPVLLFMCVCDVCKIKINHVMEMIMYSVQTLLYLCVCTIGSCGIFYRTVEFHIGPAGGYLTKTYGPAHSLYIVTMILYLILAILVSTTSIRRKNKVSAWNVDVIILISILNVGCYLLERMIRLNVELMPFVFTIGVVIVLFSSTKMSRYAIEDNPEITSVGEKRIGYIVFTNKLSYMGCNEHAEDFLPELRSWELGKEIPGNGGTFNTFLRQPFLQYVKSEQKGHRTGKNVRMKERKVHYEMKLLHYRKRRIGYVIELMDVTDYVSEESEVNPADVK